MEITPIPLVPLVPDLLPIARLYLEKYDLLADEDKKIYRDLITATANPPLIVKDGMSEEELGFVNNQFRRKKP